jgi:porin
MPRRCSRCARRLERRRLRADRAHLRAVLQPAVRRLRRSAQHAGRRRQRDRRQPSPPLPNPAVTGTFVIYNSQETATIDPFTHTDGTTFGTDWTFKHTLWDKPGGQLFGALYAINQNQANIALDPRVFIAGLIATGAVPKATKDSWALYYNAYQYVSGDEQQGWGPFLRAGISDGDPNPVKWNVAVGLGGKGTFFDRDNDRWGAGYHHLGMSDAGLLAGLHIGDEDGAELFYNLAITPALHLTFDTQLVSSARPRQQTAGIFATRLRADF